MREALKLCFLDGVARRLVAGDFFPVHVEVHVTNKCNLNCKYCMFRSRDRNLELKYEDVMDVLELAASYGCKAVTFSGGGEPLVHPSIKEIVRDAKALGLKVGIVTNGHRLRELNDFDLSNIDWIRIGLGDDRLIEKLPGYWEIIDKAMFRGRNVSWSFSYVVTDHPDYELIDMMLDFSVSRRIDEVVFVEDINSKDSEVLVKVRRKLTRQDRNTDMVRYQSKPERYAGKCYASVISPVLAADGYWYPCSMAVLDVDNRLSDKRLADGLKDIMSRKEVVEKKCRMCCKAEINRAVGMLKDIRFPEFI